MNKRYGNKWPGSVGGGCTTLHDFPNGFPQNPNQPVRTRRLEVPRPAILDTPTPLTGFVSRPSCATSRARTSPAR